MSLFPIQAAFSRSKTCQRATYGICLFSSLTFCQGADLETNSYLCISNLTPQSRESAVFSNYMTTSSKPDATRGTRPVPAQPSVNFSNLDIGSPQLRGSSKPVEDGWDIIAGGADIWGKSDQFHYVFKEITGDFDIAVRVESFMPAHLYSKAGLMIRETLDASSPHLMFLVFADNGPRNNNQGAYEMQYRVVAGGDCQAIYPAIKPPVPPEFPATYPNSWLRVQRRGNRFSAFASTDGKTWKLYAEHVLTLASTVKVGPALTSHNPQLPAKAGFRDYSISK